LRRDLAKRLSVLEARAKPRLISTLADFVIWCAEDEPDKDVEFSPQMEEFVDKTLKNSRKRNKATILEPAANLRAV
jgi:hypothetical protein